MTAVLLALALAAAPCPTPPFTGWDKPIAVSATGDYARALPLAVGRATQARLRPAKEVRFAVPPGRPAPDGSSGGSIAFSIPAAGTWQVALDAPAWIDVIKDGRPIASTSHRHGPECSGIRKIVAFELKAGTHHLQISGASAAEVKVMVAR